MRRLYLNCDFSGIQDYVLGVKSGKAQAKRLRARSFLLELFEHAALATIRDRFGVADDDVLIRGGGGFLVRLPSDGSDSELEKTRAELQRRLWEESGGEVHMSIGWGESDIQARRSLELEKRRPANSTLLTDGAWDSLNFSLPPMGDPCEVCGQAPGTRRVQDDDGDDDLHCSYCLRAREIGERLTRWERMSTVAPGAGQVEALGVTFRETDRTAPDSFRVGRWTPRNSNGAPLTFKQISALSTGDSRLAILKADVDDMGVRVGEIARDDPSYGLLRGFSADLHAFFGEAVQRMLEEDWRDIYTVYSGGDDLLLVGPWDQALDFAGALAGQFDAGPGQRYAITISAGIAFSPYRVPIRRGVDRAETLLESAKEREGKNSCAALDAIWSWDRHDAIIGEGKRLADWIESRAASRSLLHRLLTLLEASDPGETAMREARWAYQVERNASGTEFREWGRRALYRSEPDGRRPKQGDELAELAAEVRYALLSTRTRGGD
ncbi:MAG: hypothetical protein OXE50_11255 [Chloroflexi bacterium]|nr:hypothetical protein [Chloroflexota bacterium]